MLCHHKVLGRLELTSLMVFFVEEGTEESVWDLPEDGEEVP